ncbi:ketopantoate reductase family protein [Streptomyces sp. NRRL WC-3742]|uniref:ketopantoate reductase family protein n=1 Tax=Streptomyces sp. NRRL WC-3742 TaxID=1463934 RepID=UPI0004CC0A9D|nr:2-dehydropantoate 2-reductase [Streptomyces sp. NRRL WC-3742]
MRILIVGAGATGGFFGGRLAQAGRDVTFLVREGRARVLRERGLRIVGLGEETVIEPQLVTAGGIEGPYDLVLLTVKEAGLAGAVEDIAPAVGPRTRIVPVLNGLHQIDVLVERFGEEAVLGGVALVMAKLDENGDVAMLADMGSLVHGVRGGRTDARVEEVHEALSGAGFRTALSESIDAAMWSKWAFIASLGAVNVLGNGTVGEVAAAPGGAELAEAVVAEAASVAAAAGYPIPEADLARTRAMVTKQGSDDTSSLFRDLSAGLPVEAEQIFGDLVARAEALNVPVPLLGAVAVRVRVHNARS